MKRVSLGAIVIALPAMLLAQDAGVTTSDASVPDANLAAPPDPAALQAFADVVRVLQSPRCVNCHPNGDTPTVGDDGEPHAMHVQRGLEKVGMSCQTCHRETAVSTEPGIPPARKHWGLPPKETPMVFRGRTPAELCAQLKDPAQNGNKDFAALLHHVEQDDLVTYGWNPGGGRSVPPLSHADFVARFNIWVAAGAPCPAQ